MYLKAHSNIDVIKPSKKGRRPNIVSKSTIEKRYSILEDKLVSWYTFLAYNIEDDETRVKMWHNLARHFIGDHSFCQHVTMEKPKVGRPPKAKPKEAFWVWEYAVNDESYLHELEEFLRVTTPLVEKVSKITTQINESINSSITRYRDKDNHFTVSNDARALLAIGKTNDYHFESHIIDENLQDSISQEAIDIIIKGEESKHQKKIKCKKRNFYCNQKRKQESSKTKQKGGYKYQIKEVLEIYRPKTIIII